ncbi:MAG: EamA family transporter [Candidatus Micrarchaeaceae archaeon]
MLDYAIAAALMYTIPFVFADAFSKRVIRKIGAYRTGIIVLAAGFLTAVAASMLIPIGAYSSFSIMLAVITGILVGAGYLLFYKSIETEQVSNAIALSEIGSIIFVAFGFIVLNESITGVGIVGALIVFIGAIFIATTEEKNFNRKLLPAIASYVLWSVAFIIFSYSIRASSSFVMPLLVAKITMLAAFSIAGLLVSYKKAGKVSPKDIKEAAAIGLLEGTGTIGFSFAVVLSAIGLAGIINALSPVIGGSIGYMMYKERFTKLQAYGFAAMIIGALVVVIS